MTPKLKNLAFFEKDKSLGVFAEVQDINENILALTEAVKTIPPVEFPEIPEMPEVDFTETNRLLQELLDKESKSEDINITLELV